MPQTTAKNGNGKRHATQQSVNSAVKAICDIMRRSNCAGALQYVPELVQSKSFSEMLEATIRKYQNRTIEAAQVIAELIELAKLMREGHKRGEKLVLIQA